MPGTEVTNGCLASIAGLEAVGGVGGAQGRGRGRGGGGLTYCRLSQRGAGLEWAQDPPERVFLGQGTRPEERERSPQQGEGEEDPEPGPRPPCKCEGVARRGPGQRAWRGGCQASPNILVRRQKK